jgi:2-oxoglutarate dehydrogenase E2 component (dihydrolipoamide succinyltransferase)
MAIEIKVPSPGESITQVQIAKWFVNDRDEVEKDQEVVEIDSDKATFPLAAPVDGIIKIMIREGETVQVGTVIAVVEPSAVTPKHSGIKNEKREDAARTPDKIQSQEKLKKSYISPLAEKVLDEKRISKVEVVSYFNGKRVTKKDIEKFISSRKQPEVTYVSTVKAGSREAERKKLTTLRLKLAERLVKVKNETAMLTTFNEINMRAVLDIKTKYNEQFKEKFGTSLGLMSFFTKAVTLAIKSYPGINSMIDGSDLVIPHYVDIGIAVSAPKGLVVPVLKNVEMMSFAEIETRIRELAIKARENKLSVDEMQGGTFTITNGGVFGSLMSTPILNPPQSAILGMHKISDRPIAVNGKVEIHPMMYVALSYDHRVIDGSESVSFLVKIKDFLEAPVRMLTEGEDPVGLLLDL